MNVFEGKGDSGAQSKAQSAGVAQWLGNRNWLFWLSFVALLVAWELLGSAQLVSRLILVPPSDILDRGVELYKSGSLTTDVRASGLEFVLGFSMGAVAGIVVGIMIGAYGRADRLLSPYVSGLYAVPVIAFSPLFIIAFGLGIFSKVVVVAFVVVFPMIFVTSAGVRSTEASFRELGRAFNLKPWESVVKIVLPSSIPYILSGLRVATGRGLAGVLAAELFGARDGVGLLILQSAATFDTAGIFVGIVIFAFAGIVFTAFFFLLERKLAPWRETVV